MSYYLLKENARAAPVDGISRPFSLNVQGVLGELELHCIHGSVVESLEEPGSAFSNSDEAGRRRFGGYRWQFRVEGDVSDGRDDASLFEMGCPLVDELRQHPARLGYNYDDHLQSSRQGAPRPVSACNGYFVNYFKKFNLYSMETTCLNRGSL